MSLSFYIFTFATGLICAAFLGKDFSFLKPSIVSTKLDALDATCGVIDLAVSSDSKVFYLGSTEYETDIHHFASSAIEKARCTVRPMSPQDLGKILQIVGWTKTPFAITGGGHSFNPGFSSTTGIHIAMSQFTELYYNKGEATVDIGAGLRWEDVYGLLNPQGYTVVGGRVNGVGVAGFILGGGLSWMTNEHGLTIDTLVSCEIVLPNGTVTTASADMNTDLFFGIRGGFNNFGVVTKFTLKVFPQNDIWGGAVTVPESQTEQAIQAIANFATNVRDPKATMNVIFDYAEGSMNTIVIIFYNAPEPPADMFDEVLALPGTVNVSRKPFIKLLSAGQPRNTPRRIQHVAPVQSYSPSLLCKVANETKYWGTWLEKHHSVHFVDYVVEVFLPGYFNHGPSSAWPADRATVHYPINVVFAWFDRVHDQAVHEALKHSIMQLRTQAEAEGQEIDNASLYPNIVISGTPLEQIYGKNLERLREIRDVYDPSRTMNLAGGWHF